MEEFLTQHTEITYAFSVVVLSWIILQYFVRKSTNDRIRIFITMAVGIILGAAWLKWINPAASIERLVFSLFAAMGFYKVIIKQIQDKIGFDYNDNAKDKSNDSTSEKQAQ